MACLYCGDGLRQQVPNGDYPYDANISVPNYPRAIQELPTQQCILKPEEDPAQPRKQVPLLFVVTVL